MGVHQQPVAICIDEVSHSYGERQALAGISLEVKSGEMFGLLGPNGGGKTTLFKILSTLMRSPEDVFVSLTMT